MSIQPSVVVLRHHHGTSYLSALTPEELKRAMLHILEEYSGLNPERERVWGAYPSAAHCREPDPPAIGREAAEALPPSKAREAALAELDQYDEKIEEALEAREDREKIALILREQHGGEALRMVRELWEHWFEGFRIESLTRPWDLKA